MSKVNLSLKSNLKSDLPASIIVFLVAVPLCLGIALASGAPLISGIISGVVGGILVGFLSNSSLGVSGPAAGLTAVTLISIQELGSFEIFLSAVVISGIIQLIFGFLKGGIIGYYMPNSVIKGMLVAIGLIIFLKQIPHAFGYDKNFEGDLTFSQSDGQNTFTELINIFTTPDALSIEAIFITSISLIILILWDTKFFKKIKLFNIFKGQLLVVIVGILINLFFQASDSFNLSSEHTVNLDIKGSTIGENISSFKESLYSPDFSMIYNIKIWTIALTLALVASVETLLCVEATDKIDPFKRITNTDRELKAQGMGNLISGLLGGLPVTQVVVRSSANIQSGGRTKISTISHGILILTSVVIFPNILNLIPYASLAAILLMIGYKLAKPKLFKQMWKLGSHQFIPFISTVLGILFTDLLIGIGIGLGVSIINLLYANFKTPYHYETSEIGEEIRIELSENVSFLNKAAILDTFKNIPDKTKVILDLTRTIKLDYDVIEIIEDFRINSLTRDIDLQIIDSKKSHLKQLIK
ncbi:SulP family inorganic anion transporter [Candidatus Kapabacteria bacterium]|nr:SulP family inorganic anion transporter [Candidatus Kapabacteria bacterium]